jgi:hypothetical protein
MFITFVLFHGNYCELKKTQLFDITKIRRGKRWTSEVGSRLPYLKESTDGVIVRPNNIYYIFYICTL